MFLARCSAVSRQLANHAGKIGACRGSSYCKIDESIFGLSDEQKEVSDQNALLLDHRSMLSRTNCIKYVHTRSRDPDSARVHIRD